MRPSTESSYLGGCGSTSSGSVFSIDDYASFDGLTCLLMSSVVSYICWVTDGDVSSLIAWLIG